MGSLGFAYQLSRTWHMAHSKIIQTPGNSRLCMYSYDICGIKSNIAIQMHATAQSTPPCSTTEKPSSAYMLTVCNIRTAMHAAACLQCALPLHVKLQHWQHDAASALLQPAWLAGNEGTQSEARVCNPPMIHGLAVAPTDDAPAAHLVAAACGDGNIRIWDLEQVCSISVCI